MDLGIQNRRALVTGSDRGTGAIIARQLEQEGVQVIRHSSSENHYLEQIRQNPEQKIVWGDLSQQNACNDIIKQLWQITDHIDILVNNYGTASGGKWTQLDDNDWIEIYQKNVMSCVRMTEAILEPMKARKWGRIIQLSTIGSLSPNARMPHYYASKAALSNISVSLAKELSGTGITVNTVSPGLILTDEVKAFYTLKAKKKGWGESWEEIEAAILTHEFPNLCQTLATREDISDTVCFLASKRASLINAQNIRVDGGSIALSV